jgi:TRAP-type C4-dicarboxylate transport system permease small subunit
LVGSVFLSIPDVFLRRDNIVVDLVDHLFGRRAIDLLKAIANLLAIAFLAVLAWRMLPPALDAMRFNEVSPDLAIPMGVHWSLMIAGIVLALPAAAWILLESLQPLWRAQNKQQGER